MDRGAELPRDHRLALEAEPQRRIETINERYRDLTVPHSGQLHQHLERAPSGSRRTQESPCIELGQDNKRQKQPIRVRASGSIIAVEQEAKWTILGGGHALGGTETHPGMLSRSEEIPSPSPI